MFFIWVLVVVVGFLVVVLFQVVGDFIDVVDKIKFVGVGLFSYFGNVIVRVVLNLFKVVVEVGEVMWGKD